MKKETKKLEDAKSYFVLAQIFIILAGFLFAGSSIALTNAQNSLVSSSDITFKSVSLTNFKILNMEKLEANNLTQEYSTLINAFSNSSEASIDLSEVQINYAKTGFEFAIIFVFMSLCAFLFGKYRISKIKTD